MSCGACSHQKLSHAPHWEAPDPMHDPHQSVFGETGDVSCERRLAPQRECAPNGVPRLGISTPRRAAPAKAMVNARPRRSTPQGEIDTLGFEPKAFRMRSGCDFQDSWRSDLPQLSNNPVVYATIGLGKAAGIRIPCDKSAQKTILQEWSTLRLFRDCAGLRDIARWVLRVSGG